MFRAFSFAHDSKFRESDIENNIKCVYMLRRRRTSKTRRFEKCGPELIRYNIYMRENQYFRSLSRRKNLG